MAIQNENQFIAYAHFNGNELFVVFLWNIFLFLAVNSLFATIHDSIKYQTLSQWITSNAYRWKQPTFFCVLIKVGPFCALVFEIEKLLAKSDCDIQSNMHLVIQHQIQQNRLPPPPFWHLFEEIHISTMVEKLKML